jgi:prepilin-type N-terminal cleavage/methylation domain-containing protein
MKATSQKGFSLLEVVIAIAIFAIGMLALASLQGSLTRAATDANLRTIAANIAERTIEDLRGFGRIDVDPADLIPAYADIIDSAATDITDGNIVFSRSIEVTDYYYDLPNDNFTVTAPTGIAVSDFKLVEVTVSWGAGADFQIDDSQELTSAEIGSGEITLSAMVSSVSTQGAGRVSTQEDDNDFDPFINYTPGENPDIVSLTLGPTRFKESLTPEPRVIREEELVETRFDVVTYSQSGDSSLFLRREEFIAVSCECTLRAPSGDSSLAGRRPAIWVGDEYLEPEFVSKTYGESANNIQSPFCDTCCQDHHDGGTGTYDPDNDTGAILFNPYRAKLDYWGVDDTFSGDHKHYKKNRRGELSIADSAGDTYVEACRLVRKDGFFRVAQDFRMEGVNVFPYDYLDSSNEVTAYSTWLTTAVDTFTDTLVASGYSSSDAYDFIAPDLGEPSRTPYPSIFTASGDLTLDYTVLPTALSADFQQLRSRGIYIDYMSKDLRDTIGCLDQGGDVDTCQYGDVILDKTGSGNILEIIPFFEVQMTYLHRWTENPLNKPVDTTNETLVTNNAHSRGVASKEATTGNSTVTATGPIGVLGFTDSDPIDQNYNSELFGNEIQVRIDTSGNPTSTDTIVVGHITSGVNGVQATNVEIEGNNATCNRTNEGFICQIPTGSTNATVELSNYNKRNDNNIVACNYDDEITVVRGSDTANRPWSLFGLSNAVAGYIYNFSIEPVSCLADSG